MSIVYRTAVSGGGTYKINDFEFGYPIVTNVSQNEVTLKIDYGFYNPNDIWKQGQKEIRLNEFCLKLPYNKIQEIRDNQIMVSISNSNIKSYIKSPC